MIMNFKLIFNDFFNTYAFFTKIYLIIFKKNINIYILLAFLSKNIEIEIESKTGNHAANMG